jgi:hypothetical protein
MRPIAKSIFVCDDVVADVASGKVSVLNLLNAVRVPPDERLPYRLAKLCTFAVLRGGRGLSRFQVRIRRADTGDLFTSTSEQHISFQHPHLTIYLLFRMTEINVPVAGEYFVELYCDDQFVDDQVVKVLQTEEQ